jgi:hypothetical protein
MSTLSHMYPIKKAENVLVAYFEMEACNYR